MRPCYALQNRSGSRPSVPRHCGLTAIELVLNAGQALKAGSGWKGGQQRLSVERRGREGVQVLVSLWVESSAAKKRDSAGLPCTLAGQNDQL